MTQEDEILSLQQELSQNPKSPLFVKLAELYLKKQLVQEAENLVKQSLKFHPRSVSGLILYGRISKLLKQPKEAIRPLAEAARLAPDNWRAWLELGEAYLEIKNGKQALTAYKKVLFFNPSNLLARRAVAKLELLTADEYEDDLFQMKKIPQTSFILEQDLTAENENKATQSWPSVNEKLTRALSFIDALIVRQEISKATDLLNECTKNHGSHPEIESRKLKLSVFESPAFIKPKSAANSKTKQQLIIEKKLRMLQMLLRRIEGTKKGLTTT